MNVSIALSLSVSEVRLARVASNLIMGPGKVDLNFWNALLREEMSFEVCSKQPKSCVVSLLLLSKMRFKSYPPTLASSERDRINLGGSSVVISNGILLLMQSTKA